MVGWLVFPSIVQLTVVLLYEAKLISLFYFIYFIFLNWVISFPDLVSCHFGFKDSKVNLHVFKQASQGLYKRLILVWCLQLSQWIL